MVGHSNENLAARWIWNWDDGDNIPEVAEGELSYKDILNIHDSKTLSLEKPPIVFSGGCSQQTRRMLGWPGFQLSVHPLVTRASPRSDDAHCQ